MRSLPQGLPIVWLGQSVRTTLVLPSYGALADAPIMASLGDAVHRPRLFAKVFSGGLRDRLKTKGPIMLDSGGFTAMMQGGAAPNIKRLIEVYAATDADILISLDAPPTLKCGLTERRAKYSTTRKNLQTLVSAIGASRIVPVVHGRTIKEITANAVAAHDISPFPPMICIGGIVPLLRRTGGTTSGPSDSIEFIAEAIGAIKNIFGETILHVLGAGSPRTVLAALALGANSVDSIGWRRAAGFGTVFIAGRGERFVENRFRSRASSRPFLSQGEIATCQCPVCTEFSPADRLIALSSNYRERAAHNAWVLLEEAKLFSAAKKQNRLAEHLESRLPQSWIAAWQRSAPNGPDELISIRVKKRRDRPSSGRVVSA